jgi:hypothetical protein
MVLFYKDYVGAIDDPKLPAGVIDFGPCQ